MKWHDKLETFERLLPTRGLDADEMRERCGLLEEHGRELTIAYRDNEKLRAVAGAVEDYLAAHESDLGADYIREKREEMFAAWRSACQVAPEPELPPSGKCAECGGRGYVTGYEYVEGRAVALSGDPCPRCNAAGTPSNSPPSGKEPK